MFESELMGCFILTSISFQDTVYNSEKTNINFSSAWESHWKRRSALNLVLLFMEVKVFVRLASFYLKNPIYDWFLVLNQPPWFFESCSLVWSFRIPSILHSLTETDYVITLASFPVPLSLAYVLHGRISSIFTNKDGELISRFYSNENQHLVKFNII